MGLVALPAFRCLDQQPAAGNRYGAIDGLRGFLALSVFAFHLVVTRRFVMTGVWQVPDSRFYALLGPFGVSVFFMITGFLFWGQMLRSSGRPRWHALYLGRVLRIGPLYLLVVLAMLGIVFVRTGLRLHEPATVVVASVLPWLALGMSPAQPDVNGYDAAHVLAAVTWTLRYEWLFYASLLATSVFARRGRDLSFVVGAACVCLIAKTALHIDAIGFSVLFLGGMTMASLIHRNLKPTLPQNISSALALSCLAVIFATCHSGYGTPVAMLLAVFLYLVCGGASLFGLLATAAAQRLGHISYSLYLLQGIVLSLVFAIAPVRAYALRSPLNYWTIGALCACLLVASSALTHVLVERPGIALGRLLVRRLDQWLGRGVAVPLTQPRSVYDSEQTLGPVER